MSAHRSLLSGCFALLFVGVLGAGPASAVYHGPFVAASPSGVLTCDVNTTGRADPENDEQTRFSIVHTAAGGCSAPLYSMRLQSKLSSNTSPTVDSQPGAFGSDECYVFYDPLCAQRPGHGLIAGGRVTGGTIGFYLQTTYAVLILKEALVDPWLAVPAGCVLDATARGATCLWVDFIAAS